MRAIASAASTAVFALTLGDAGCLWRRRGRVLAHPLVAHAGEEQDLRAVVIGNRTIGPFRGLEADEVVHGGRPGLRIDCPIGSNLKERGLKFGQARSPHALRCLRPGVGISVRKDSRSRAG